MLFKKNFENLIYVFFFISIIIFYLYSKNSLFSHWSDILDQDVTLIYNAILIGSNEPQQYLDHPAFSTFFILNIFHKIGFFLNIVEIKNLDELLNHSNKDNVLQTIHNISQFVHLIYSLIFLLLLKKILNNILHDNMGSFFLSLIFLISPSFIFLFDIIRSEILSLIFLFTFYFCLENSLKKNILFMILAGVSFVCALLAKVQIILCIFSVLLIFILKNYHIKSYKKISIPNSIKIILNLSLIIFLITIIDNFFYKRIDKIFFILIVFFLIFIFSIIEKKFTGQNSSNIILALFFIGCTISILIFTSLSKIGIAYFHPALLDIITSPITVMSNITTGYSIQGSDNFDFIYKIKDYFFQARKGWGIKVLSFLTLFNMFIFSLSFLFMLKFIKDKEYLKSISIFFLNLSIIFLIIVFNFRPYFFYDIYILPLNLLLISILLQNIQYKKIFTFGIFIIYFILNFSNFSDQLNQKRANGFFNFDISSENNMKFICKEDEIINKTSYMRYWHRKYDAEFLKDLCLSYLKNTNDNTKW